MLSVCAATLMAIQLGGPMARGAVRSADTGEPIADALVELVGTGRRTTTDSGGRYELRDLESGTHPLRFSHPGYSSATVAVLVSSTGAAEVSVTLHPRSTVLQPVRVVAAASDAAGSGPDFGPGDQESSRVGAGLAGAGGIAAATVGSELPAAFHVRGGASEQTGIFLDGVPLYGAAHVAGVTTPLAPEALRKQTLYASGSPPSTNGGVAGTLAMESVQPPQRLMASGILGARGAHVFLGGPVGIGSAGFALAARTRSRNGLPVAGVQQTSTSSTFGDVMAKLVLPAAGGVLAAMTLVSADDIAFDGRVERGQPPASGVPADASGAQLRNAFRWRTKLGTLGWSKESQRWAFGTRAWASRTATAIGWAAPVGSFRVTNELRDAGLSADVRRQTSRTLTIAGLSGERLATTYTVGSVDSPRQPPSLSSNLATLAAYAEEQWRPAPRWTAGAGARVYTLTGRPPSWAPRVWAQFTAGAHARLSAGYARTGQLVQSLRNDESAATVLADIPLPVAAGGSIPVPRADQVTVEISAPMGSAHFASVALYRRRMRGLLLVAPATGEPFAVGVAPRGSGEVSGIAFRLRHHGDRLSAAFDYTGEMVARQFGNTRYTPGFAVGRLVRLEAEYRASHATLLRVTAAGASGRATSISRGAFDWAPDVPSAGPTDIAGTPQTIDAIATGRLPDYVRLDLGATHTWSASVGRRTAELGLTFAIRNVLDRANVFGLVSAGPGATPRPLTMLPRSLDARIEWRF